MKTLENALLAGKQLLKEKGIKEGDLDAWYLFSHYFELSRTQYLLHSGAEITETQYEEYLTLIKKRGNHIPLQYITREQEFMGLTFQVSEDVLIPRQDTEILVEEALKVSQDKTVLDLCTGSGCIIISLAKLGNIKSGTGVDISGKALEVARENARQLKAEVLFIESDLFSQLTGKYDIIISNPPYIPTKDIYDLMEEVKDHEPVLALDGSEDGLNFYRFIIEGISRFLKPGGYIFFEIGYNQGEAVSELLREAGIMDIKIINDLAGLNRVISGRYKKEEEPFT
ncbi:peptide chain release factor N(5)-glutamine methyltransferase [Anaerocolumna sp. AGMB13025]|uniref:peptide chain release factor N(5)-glutamine methyltransferase n=1 Tax=Anaerocolumna sp. AGMB13025 TaxID=3039116 RepID=UPI00241D0528|nr:peptide chain release factor N(5)-glutamine methyltransferase [Anaerocolumna sp. AGMB13025]WFR57975.1 peptide chain release factor N(5)-glutamine methyltransferase [Anaerocolumna sp. AGMB13025]